MPSLRRAVRRALVGVAQRVAPPELLTALRFWRAEGGVAFPKRNVQVVRDLPRVRVLVLAPHPDDEAIGMGGALAMHAANGSEVTVVYLTDGGGPDEAERAELIRVRRREATRVAELVSLRQVFLDAPDTRLTNDPALVERLAALLRELTPELVYTPSLFDHHYDHFTTNQLLVEALAAAPEVEPTICGYEVWDNVPFPNYLVDVSAHQEEKEALLACYETPHRFTDFTQLCRDRTAVYFTLYVDSAKRWVGKGFAEAYLRFDAATFRRLHAGYVASLRQDGSALAARLTERPAEAVR